MSWALMAGGVFTGSTGIYVAFASFHEHTPQHFPAALALYALGVALVNIGAHKLLAYQEAPAW